MRGILSSVVPYFVHNIALDTGVEYCRGHLDVADEDARGHNRLYVSVCLFLMPWLLAMSLPACWIQSHKDGEHPPVIPFIAITYLNFATVFSKVCHSCAAIQFRSTQVWPCDELATCPWCTLPSPKVSWDWLQHPTTRCRIKHGDVGANHGVCTLG